MTAGLVSVIVPFLDAERFLGDALRSLEAQTYPRWELLLVDDGSTDGSGALAREFCARWPDRARCLRHPGGANRGISASRNLALRHCRGEFVALLDADDAWFPVKLERQVSRLAAHSDAALVYGRTQYWFSWDPDAGSPDSTPELGVHVKTDAVHEPPDLLLANYPLGWGAAPPPSSVLFRRAILARTGAFEDGFPNAYEDQVFLTRVYRRERVFVSSECWDRYRVRPDSCTETVRRARRYEPERIAFLRWLQGDLAAAGCADVDVLQALDQALAALGAGRVLSPDVAPGEPSGRAPLDGQAPAAPARHEGYLDAVTRDDIAGWAWNPGRPGERVAVRLALDGRVFATATARLFRADLAAAGKGDGFHAFRCRVPAGAAPGARATAWIAETGQALTAVPTPPVLP